LPEFKEVFNGFLVVFRKDVYTEEYLRKLGLNERQIKAVMYVKEKGKITNKEYQKLCGVKKRQATNDLKELENKGVFERVGITGKGVYYILKGYKRGIKGAEKGQITIKYFCEDIDPKIKELLVKIREKHHINFEIVQNKPWSEEKDKEIYEKYFKPRARILRKRTGKPVTKLRSRKAKHYFVSIPGTISLFVDDVLEYWLFAIEEGIRFLEDVLENGSEKIRKILKVGR
jgi:DNA-binding Lrp family transcriptional regulator